MLKYTNNFLKIQMENIPLDIYFFYLSLGCILILQLSKSEKKQPLELIETLSPILFSKLENKCKF